MLSLVFRSILPLERLCKGIQDDEGLDGEA